MKHDPFDSTHVPKVNGLYIHLAFTYPIGPSSRSVRQTWTGSTFSTNNSTSNVMVTSPQLLACVNYYLELNELSFYNVQTSHSTFPM